MIGLLVLLVPLAVYFAYTAYTAYNAVTQAEEELADLWRRYEAARKEGKK